MRRFFFSVDVRSMCQYSMTYHMGWCDNGRYPRIESKNEENLTSSSEILGYPGHPIVGQTNVTDGDDLAFMYIYVTMLDGSLGTAKMAFSSQSRGAIAMELYIYNYIYIYI